MNAISAINAYKKVGVESKVIGADPHMLISMLFQGALLAIDNAKNEILRKDVAAKGKSISKAIAIIGEGLHASLDMRVGGELAQNLSSLYDYMVMRLSEANLKNDVTVLDEVTRLLTELAGAWDSIGRLNKVQSEPKALAHASQAYRRA
jgi:flagellar protein FliS